jgi:transcription elongation factor Elf1
MSKVFPCPHCRAQNFATRARLRRAKGVPLICWKCGKRIKKAQLISDKTKEKPLKFKKK